MEHCWTHRTAPNRRSKWLSLCRFDNGAEPDPQLIVADMDNSSLMLFGEEGNFLKEIIPSLPSWRPSAVTQGVDSTLAVCDWKANCLRLVFLDYRPSYLRSELLGADILKRPYSVAMTTVGNWVVADEDSIVLLNPFGGLITRIDHSTHMSRGGKWSPRHVTTDNQQRIIASDPMSGLVTIFDAGGLFIRHVSGVQLQHPSGLLVNDLDQLLVCDQGRACVSLFDKDGQYLYDIITREETLPRVNIDQLAPSHWRPVTLTSTTPGQVCMAAAYASEFVIQCFSYPFMPSTARSSHK